jgi:hypothetical protein
MDCRPRVLPRDLKNILPPRSNPKSRIDPPKGFATVAAGTVRLCGIAWSPHNGIDKVEVRLDNGAWQPATLSREVNHNTWRM